MSVSPKPRNPGRRSSALLPPRPYDGPLAVHVRMSRVALTVTLDDGRILTVPLSALPGLAAAPASARKRFELLGGGIGIHFPLCDEDISVANLLRPQFTMSHHRR